MSLAHFNNFGADIVAIKRGSRFYHPTINLADRMGPETSVMGLIRYLQANLAGPPITMADAMGQLNNPADSRVRKYMPAIERLVQVWGTGNPYPAIPPGRDERREKALHNFGRALLTIPGGIALPTWQNLEGHAANAFAFGHALGPGYILRIPNPQGGGNLDITARSLLLGAGLTPLINGIVPNSYTESLQLTEADLRRMRGRSILDVGCGGAFFRAEMATLFGCQTDGIDLNALPAVAVTEGRRRYVWSMLYLKMLKDRNQLPAVSPVTGWAVDYIDRIIANLPAILNHYQNNLPQVGDLLNNFQATATGIRAVGWDYAVTMFVLCYFNAGHQTTAVNAMCGVTNRMVLLFNGAGGGVVGSLNLSYNHATITGNYPGCAIQVLDALTHRIRMP
jgi:hypothetical protein